MPPIASARGALAGAGSLPGSWRVGAASATLPVAAGSRLDGYVARQGVASGTHDDISVAALVLERDAARRVLIAADVVAVDRTLVWEIAGATGVAAAVLLVCASHTHSGPAGLVPRLHPSQPDRADPQLRTRFAELCGTVVAEAAAGATTATLWLGQAAVPGVAANRNDPAAPRDDTASVLGTRRPDGSWLAVVVHFACHPTVLGADNLLVSADFPGALRRSLGARYRRAAQPPVLLFVNGAAGDVSTRFTRRGQGFDEVERLGRLLANGVEAALTNARPIEGPLRSATASVSLHRSIPRSLNAADSDVALLPPSGGAERRAITRAEGAVLAAGLPAGQEGPVPVGLDAVRLGDLAMVGVPGELLANLGHRIVAGSPFGTTLVAGYANDYVGYLVDETAAAATTYEALASRFTGAAGEAVVAAAVTLLERLASGNASNEAPTA